MMKVSEMMTPEINRLIERGMPVPNMEPKNVPYDKIIVTSGRHQVRRINLAEDKILTNQIEKSGLLNPIVLMPYGDTGKYVPLSGHTRQKSCKAISEQSPTTAIELQLHEGMPAFIYDEEITDILEFKAIANVLNDHPQANAHERADIVEQVLGLYAEGYFQSENGVIDHNAAVAYLKRQDLQGFSDRALGGIIQTVKSTLTKSDRLNFDEGTIQTFDNKKHLNGRLFQKFSISDNTSHDHYVETEDGVIANCIRGIGPSNSLWVTEQLASFADYQMDLKDHGIDTDERILYWHVTNIVDCNEELTALECLQKTRKELLNMARKKARVIQSEYRPTKIAFIPQFQVSVDADGNEVFGEEVTYYEM